MAVPVVCPGEAVSGFDSFVTSSAPAKPSPTPITPPMRPSVTDSPMTWPTMRRLRQPIAFSVPNSRTRRETADRVSRLASRNAAISTAMASHLPRLLARLEALDSEPVTSLARSAEVVTVSEGRALLDLALHGGDVRGAVGRDVDGVHVVLHVGQLLRDRERDVDVRRVVAGRSPTMPTTLKFVVVPLLLPIAMVEPTVSLFCVA